MATWLVCKRCDVKEWLQPHTDIVGCNVCGAARYAENDDGQPMFLFSSAQDLTSWGGANGQSGTQEEGE